MRNDLHAVASIDWAVSNLPSFETKIDAWLRDNVYADVIDVQGNTADKMVVAVEKELLPLSFVVEAGAYINAIRSSLDILASSLARRFGVAGDEQIQFPIASDLTAYRDGRYKGAKFVEALPDHERGLIEDLKPYQGGNPALWALRQLDIVRKHRRLLSVYVNPRSVSIRGPAGFGFKPVPFIAPVDDKTVLGFIPRRPSKPDINVACHISFDEALLGFESQSFPHSTSSCALRRRSSNCSTHTAIITAALRKKLPPGTGFFPPETEAPKAKSA